MMANLIDERKYPSTRRGSTAKYLCKKWGDGSYSCDCPGWRFKQPDKPRGCSHCEWFKQDYWLVPIAEASRRALGGEQYDVITTYARTLYLIKLKSSTVGTTQVTGRTTLTDVLFKQKQAIERGAEFKEMMREQQEFRKEVRKQTQPQANPGRARRVFDEEV